MRRTLLTPVLALVAAACGSHPPTTPSTTTGAGAAPSAAIDVKADAAGSRDAIAALSEVVADASRSTGTGLTFSIDFGDGTTATTASAKHVYSVPASYTITATVTDPQGRTASAANEIVVRTVTGSWFHAGAIERTKRVEVRQLTIDAQDGASVRGTYRLAGSPNRPFTGALTAPREIHLTAGSVSLDGTLPGRLNDEAVSWPLIVQGDGADGQRLDFRAITGPPEGPPPDAAMTVRFANGEVVAIPAVTPISIDATASRGTDLTSFIEFGEGTIVADSRATRTVDKDMFEPYLTARVTVVDRFGRSDSESLRYYLYDLGARVQDVWYSGANVFDAELNANFWRPGLGTTYGVHIGTAAEHGESVATVGADYSIRITMPSGIEYQGTLFLVGEIRMVLVQRGGLNDGRTWTLHKKEYS